MRLDLLASRGGRRGLFAALYLSEGAPIGYIWWFLPTRLRVEGVPIGEIGALTALLVLPWTLKFLWAPLVDLLARRGVSPRWWIIAAQFVMGATLLPLFSIDATAQIELLRVVLVAHAFAAATQDVAIDTLAIRSTPRGELGSMNGWMQAGMLLGRSAFGGAALYVRSQVGDAAVVAALIAVVWANLVLVALVTEPAARVTPSIDAPSFLRTLGAAARRPATWLGLCFAAISGAAFEGIGAVAGPYLVDRGLDERSIGAFLAGPAVACMLGGALLGGFVADRWGRTRAAGGFLVLIVGAGLALAGLNEGPDATILGTLGVLYTGIGCFTASSYALFMGLTDPTLGATQFSAFMAATNGCESWAALATGTMAQAKGYGAAFTAMAAVSLVSLALLKPIGRALKAERPGPGAVAGRIGDPDRPRPRGAPRPD